MKILICGDSYCDNYKKEPNSWISHLTNLLQVSVNAVGVRGCSNYNILQQYKNNYKKYDCVIVAKTATSRIPFIKNFPHLSSFNPKGLIKSNAFRPTDYDEALKFYLKYYYDDDYGDWVSQHAVDDITDLQPEKQKIIWINSINNNITHTMCEKNIIIKGSLMDISDLEARKIGYKNLFDFINFDPNETGKVNHLSLENNYNLALYLKNVILGTESNTNLLEQPWS